jgi:hypothetical protein
MNHPVGLLEDALVTRRAGHPDQLSARTSAIDRFRIFALMKLLADIGLAGERRFATVEVLREKCAIYAGGLRRREKTAHANFYDSIGEQAPAWTDRPDPDLSRANEVIRTILADTSAIAPCVILSEAKKPGS